MFPSKLITFPEELGWLERNREIFLQQREIYSGSAEIAIQNATMMNQAQGLAQKGKENSSTEGKMKLRGYHPMAFCWPSPCQEIRGLFLLPFGLCCICFPGGASGKEPTCQCRKHKRCGQTRLKQLSMHACSLRTWEYPLLVSRPYIIDSFAY